MHSLLYSIGFMYLTFLYTFQKFYLLFFKNSTFLLLKTFKRVSELNSLLSWAEFSYTIYNHLLTVFISKMCLETQYCINIFFVYFFCYTAIISSVNQLIVFTILNIIY